MPIPGCHVDRLDRRNKIPGSFSPLQNFSFPGSANRILIFRIDLHQIVMIFEKVFGSLPPGRERYAEAMLGEKPEFEPGSQYGYSNSGFVVVGVMLETISGKLWEDLMKERVFAPLKMTSAGFGGAAKEGKEDQPWGHHPGNKPQEPGPQADNPDVIGPAGTVHLSLADLARFVKMHATHEVGPVLKKAETFTYLQTIGEGNKDYACGWMVVERGWAKGPALTHSGSNTMNFCTIWIAPERKFGAIAVTNADIDSGSPPCDAVIGKFIETYLK